jgi:hypothetical protein
MKNALLSRDAEKAPMLPEPSARYQIVRQARAGNFMAEFETNSAMEAVEMFTIMAPAFDGGAIRMWDHREQRVCAAVHWETEKTDFGFLVHHRTNVFHDRLLGVLARQVNKRETLRASLRREADMSLAV